MSEPGAASLLPLPARGRRFTDRRRVRLGDVDPAGALRLDGVARLLQDVAADDAADAGVDGAFGWIVRRTMIVVRTPATLAEPIELTTWCTGVGRSWAERRTTILGSRGAVIEAVSLWIQVDLASGRPAALDARFDRAWGEAAAGRRVSTRRTLPAAPADANGRRWQVRRADLDPFGHVNNAAQWAVVEELVENSDRAGVGEIEYAVPVDLDQQVELRTADATAEERWAWLVADGTTLTAARWRPGADAAGPA